MILAVSAWDLITLQAIEEELEASPWLSPEEIARIVASEALQFAQPTPEERKQPN
jgi:hypothetical protein